MITILSLLPEASTASWTEWKRQREASASLIRRSFFAFFVLSFLFGRLGRRRKPSRLALVIERCAISSEVLAPAPLQTTRISPGPSPVTAEASERAVGTSPPAAGLTDV